MEPVMQSNQTRHRLMSVWLESTAAVKKGQAFCFDRDYGTATAFDSERDQRVVLPDNTNNMAFAGVAVKAYGAVSGATGQMIELMLPGSVGYIYVDGSVTIGQNTFVNFIVGGSTAGQFHGALAGFMGKGAARVMQTRTGAGLVLAELMEGDQSGGIEIHTLTTASTGALTFTPHGVTKIIGGVTTTNNVTNTLANGTFPGQQKRFVVSGTIGTYDLIISPTSSNIQAPKPAGTGVDAWQALATVSLDGDGEQCLLEWTGSKWLVVHTDGATLTP